MSGSLALRAQPAARHAGVVRDDALAAPAVELLQTRHVVDGPDVHLHAVLLAVAHVLVREQLVPRAVVVVESMAAITLTDLLMQNMTSRIEYLKNIYL